MRRLFITLKGSIKTRFFTRGCIDSLKAELLTHLLCSLTKGNNAFVFLS